MSHLLSPAEKQSCLQGITTNMLDRSQSGYNPSPSSRVYDEHCTPVAEINYKRFEQQQPDGSMSDELWSLVCAFADPDEADDGGEEVEEELTAVVTATDPSEEEGQSFSEDLDIMMAEDVIDLDNQNLNISKLSCDLYITRQQAEQNLIAPWHFLF